MAKDAGDDPDAPARPKGGILGVVALAIACFGGSAITMYVVAAPADPVAATCDAATETAASKADGPVMQADQVTVALNEFLITIGPSPATRYLKMKVSILTDKDGEALVNKSEPMLQDAFNTYLRAVTIEDFEDPGFYARMREQLLIRSELVLGGSAVQGVLITEFLLR